MHHKTAPTVCPAADTRKNDLYKLWIHCPCIADVVHIFDIIGIFRVNFQLIAKPFDCHRQRIFLHTLPDSLPNLSLIHISEPTRQYS